MLWRLVSNESTDKGGSPMASLRRQTAHGEEGKVAVALAVSGVGSDIIIKLSCLFSNVSFLCVRFTH